MGRCGRAGNRDGRGIVFYGPNEKELVEVVREAEEQQSRMTLSQDVDDCFEDKESMEKDTEGKEDGEDDGSDAGKVKKAFSRRRGFTKKRKKAQREAREQ